MSCFLRGFWSLLGLEEDEGRSGGFLIGRREGIFAGG
jgi:hypothetical protein